MKIMRNKQFWLQANSMIESTIVFMAILCADEWSGMAGYFAVAFAITFILSCKVTFDFKEEEK